MHIFVSLLFHQHRKNSISKHILPVILRACEVSLLRFILRFQRHRILCNHLNLIILKPFTKNKLKNSFQLSVATMDFFFIEISFIDLQSVLRILDVFDLDNVQNIIFYVFLFLLRLMILLILAVCFLSYQLSSKSFKQVEQPKQLFVSICINKCVNFQHLCKHTNYHQLSISRHSNFYRFYFQGYTSAHFLSSTNYLNLAMMLVIIRSHAINILLIVLTLMNPSSLICYNRNILYNYFVPCIYSF